MAIIIYIQLYVTIHNKSFNENTKNEQNQLNRSIDYERHKSSLCLDINPQANI